MSLCGILRFEGSDDSDPVNLLVLPGISPELRRGSESTGSASLLPNVVGVTAAPPASDMGALAPGFSEGGGSLGHG